MSPWPPQPHTRAPRTPRTLSRAGEKHPLGLASGGLASLSDVHPLGWRGNGLLVISNIIMMILIVFGSGYKEELGKWKVTWPCPSFVAFPWLLNGTWSVPRPPRLSLLPSRHPPTPTPTQWAPPPSRGFSPPCHPPSGFCVTARLKLSSVAFPGHDHFWPPKHLHPVCVRFLTKWSSPGSPTLGRQAF